MARRLVTVGLDWAYRELEQVVQKMDGCVKSGHPDGRPAENCDTRAHLYRAFDDVRVLLKILD